MPISEGAPRTPHGRVAALLADDDRAGALVSVRCSSEAFARSGEFIDYVDRLCRHVLERAPRDVAELAEQDWSYEGGTVEQAQLRFAQEVGENVRVQRLARFCHPEGRAWAWLHPDHQRGVLLSLVTGAPDECLREVAFQLAGQILVEREGELVMGEQGPEEVFDPEHLAARPWRRDPGRRVGQVLEDALGEGSRLLGYARFDVG